ncbi:DUF3180 domain-containing protein [Naasia sp. SYSU D00057]|uniref:DUF3180 domain-containing protein n=1 Tax=Naasia sp. SYSU D00057 TaxID=2817380 RepID=UPI001B307F4B|nr:DUF3180 domain-containing protein [Naasia sp. SYSU D00057]
MRRTGIALPAGLAIAGAVVGWLLQVGLAAGGRAAIVPPYSLPVTLLAIGLIVVLAGWPIRQAVRGTSKRRIDPFRALRVLLLAKASTLVGALLGGAALGIALYLLSRPVLPPPASLVATLVTLVAAIVLVVCGLLVEHWCRIPPEDDAERTAALDLQGE